MNHKREQQTILNEILGDRRRTIRKTKTAIRKNLNKKKRTCWYKAGRTDLWWECFVSGVTPKENLRLEEASFFDLVSHLRPYTSPNPNSPNRRALCADKKVAITLDFLKDCGTLSMTANSFGIATNTASAVINEVRNVIVLYVGPKFSKPRFYCTSKLWFTSNNKV